MAESDILEAPEEFHVPEPMVYRQLCIVFLVFVHNTHTLVADIPSCSSLPDQPPIFSRPPNWGQGNPRDIHIHAATVHQF